MEAIQSSLSKLRLKLDDSPGLQKLEVNVLTIDFIAFIASSVRLRWFDISFTHYISLNLNADRNQNSEGILCTRCWFCDSTCLHIWCRCRNTLQHSRIHFPCVKISAGHQVSYFERSDSMACLLGILCVLFGYRNLFGHTGLLDSTLLQIEAGLPCLGHDGKWFKNCCAFCQLQNYVIVYSALASNTWCQMHIWQLIARLGESK